jgi:hypothetical protein
MLLRRFDAVDAAGAAPPWKLTLALARWNGPSLVTVYGIDGLQLAPSDRHRFWRLCPATESVERHVRPGPGGLGGLVIATWAGNARS